MAFDAGARPLAKSYRIVGAIVLASLLMGSQAIAATEPQRVAEEHSPAAPPPGRIVPTRKAVRAPSPTTTASLRASTVQLASCAAPGAPSSITATGAANAATIAWLPAPDNGTPVDR